MTEVRKYILPLCDEREVLRYARCPAPDTDMLRTVRECIALSGCRSGSVCFDIFPLSLSGDMVDLGFARTVSKNLSAHLAGCSRVCLFAATIGLEADRLIARTARLSPARTVILQAVFTERVEALCDLFEQETAEKHRIRKRFSPGYGDVPLSLQRECFAALTPEKLIGLTLNDSLLMSPSKSVTALIGIEE